MTRFNENVPYIGHINPSVPVTEGTLVIAEGCVYEVIAVEESMRYTNIYTQEEQVYYHYKCVRSKIKLPKHHYLRYKTMGEYRDDLVLYMKKPFYFKPDEVIVPPQDVLQKMAVKRTPKKPEKKKGVDLLLSKDYPILPQNPEPHPIAHQQPPEEPLEKPAKGQNFIRTLLNRILR